MSSEGFPLPRKRSAGTPPSTFLFLLIHLSNSLGPMGSQPPGLNPRAVEAYRLPTVRSEAWSPNISEELRRHAIAPRRRQAVWRLYMSAARFLSTVNCRKFVV